MERKSISSDVITRAYIDSLLVEVRHLDAVMPSTEMTLFTEQEDALAEVLGAGLRGERTTVAE